MDERLRFVARLVVGEKMATLCAEFGISRVGAAASAGDQHRPRRPRPARPRQARRRRRHRAQGTALGRPTEPNALWCADDNGAFMLGNRRSCSPLTITDFASPHLLPCEALSTTHEKFAFTVFERTFKEFGLPQTMRLDNGVPFASAHALYGLSKLSVWWRCLGIHIERIKPGHPTPSSRNTTAVGRTRPQA